MRDVNLTYCGDRFIYVKSWSTPETDIMLYINYISVLENECQFCFWLYHRTKLLKLYKKATL